MPRGVYRADNAIALDLYSDALTLFNELDDKRGIAESLEGLAAVAAVQGRAHDGARVFGLAAQLRESSGAPLLAGDGARYDSALAAAREQLEDDDEWSWAGTDAVHEAVQPPSRKKSPGWWSDQCHYIQLQPAGTSLIAVGPWTTTTKTVNRVRTCRSLRERDRHPAPRTPTRAYRSRHWVSQSP
jgi:hypothetical protein